MKEEQYAEAKKLKRLMEEANENIKKLRELEDRVEQISGKYQKFIEIQIAEQFMATPKPPVRLGGLQEFINNEIEEAIKRRQELVEQFEKL